MSEDFVKNEDGSYTVPEDLAAVFDNVGLRMSAIREQQKNLIDIHADAIKESNKVWKILQTKTGIDLHDEWEWNGITKTIRLKDK